VATERDLREQIRDLTARLADWEDAGREWSVVREGLRARLASAERTIGEFKATNRLLYGERDTLKATVEQAHIHLQGHVTHGGCSGCRDLLTSAAGGAK